MKKIILCSLLLVATVALKAQDIASRGNNICDSFTIDFSDTSSGLLFHFLEEGFTPNGMVIPERRWYFGDPNSDSANFSMALEPDHMFTAQGSYNVCIAADGKLPGEPGGNNVFCYDSTCRTVVVLASGIGNQMEVPGNSFYPNPSRGIIFWQGNVNQWRK